MDYLDIDIDTTVDAFLADMTRGLAGKKSTLDMLPTYIDVNDEIPVNKRVIVADAGGTNFRVATVYFDDDKKPVIENLRLFKMPGAKQEVGKDEFFKIIAGCLKNVAGAADNIGFCFSYAVEMLPNKDGRLIRLSKEVKAQEIEGQLIGENLNNALAAMGIGADKHIVLLNDTVATLLAGLGYKNNHDKSRFSSYIGFILGTGTNCCYIEKNSQLKKILVRRSDSEGGKDLDPSKSQIINTESGCFGRIKRGKIDVAFDKSTTNPGVHKFEKMISGAYLGPLTLRTIHNGCTDNLFSTPVAGALWQMSDLQTKDMNDFLLHPYGDNPLANACKQGKNEDILNLYYIADRLTERAAKLVAINLSAIAIKSNQGFDPTHPIRIVAEGTTFYQMKTLKQRAEFYLKQYLENKMGIYYEIVNVENATLIGAAIAGLTN
jgi:hexokinase